MKNYTNVNDEKYYDLNILKTEVEINQQLKRNFTQDLVRFESLKVLSQKYIR